MQHRIILRAAAGLTLLLLLISLAFGFAAGQREQRLGSRASATPAVFDENAAAAAFEARCSMCHQPDSLLSSPGKGTHADARAALLEFLKSHEKASESDNQAIATWLAKRNVVAK